ncbi:MAG: DUF1573 domain-containing protein [Rikenellaceae bacterium]
MRFILLIINLLAVNIAAANQYLQFKELTWDFGTIEETGGKVTHIFDIENGSDTPVVIHGVSASCGCTVPTYSRKPIMGGEKSTITITFDPLYRPGRFVKEIYVYLSDREEPVELKIMGVVNERELSIEERYPFKIGEQVRIGTLHATIRGVKKGESVMTAVEYINISNSDIDIEFIPRRKGEDLLINYSRHLKSNKSVTMSLGYDRPEQLEAGEILRDTVDIYVNGVLSDRVLYIMGRQSR